MRSVHLFHNFCSTYVRRCNRWASRNTWRRSLISCCSAMHQSFKSLADGDDRMSLNGATAWANVEICRMQCLTQSQVWIRPSQGLWQSLPHVLEVLCGDHKPVVYWNCVLIFRNCVVQWSPCSLGTNTLCSPFDVVDKTASAVLVGLEMLFS